MYTSIFVFQVSSAPNTNSQLEGGFSYKIKSLFSTQYGSWNIIYSDNWPRPICTTSDIIEQWTKIGIPKNCEVILQLTNALIFCTTPALDTDIVTFSTGKFSGFWNKTFLNFNRWHTTLQTKLFDSPGYWDTIDTYAVFYWFMAHNFEYF